MSLPFRWAALALAATVAVLPAEAEEASAWAPGLHSRARLVAGGPDLAAIEIALDPGYKTYWRMPGESGLPPSFNFRRSLNAAELDLAWPAPRWLEDVAGVAYGYEDGVLLPIRVKPFAADKPAEVVARVDYGVCKEICIPATVDLRLTLPSAATDQRPRIEAALARVPQPQPLAADADLAIVAVEPVPAEASRFTATARAPADTTPHLFVEAPDDWFLRAAARPDPVAGKPGLWQFAVEILERPRQASGPIELRLTLTAGDRAVESTAALPDPSQP